MLQCNMVENRIGRLETLIVVRRSYMRHKTESGKFSAHDTGLQTVKEEVL